MVQRLAILLGGLGATAVLALALGAAGLFPAAPAPPLAQTAITAPTATDNGAQPQATAPQVKKQVDTVYVAPTSPAPAVHVNRHHPASAGNPNPAPAGEPGDGNRGGGDN